jgi:hypothetical protein
MSVLRFAHGFQTSVCIRLYKKFVPEASRINLQNHENDHVRCLGQGEARHRKYKRLKLGGGQAYER